jgi:predicted site-specific integrase-resolvase
LLLQTLPEILTARELEALLRIDVKTIYGYVQRGLIPYVRIQSNLRFRKQEVLAKAIRRNEQGMAIGTSTSEGRSCLPLK